MKKLFSLLLLLQALTVYAEDLPWFNIHCNLRNADYILEGKIVDTLGNIEITRDYSQVKFKEKKIQIAQFASPDNFRIIDFYEYKSLIGRFVVLFIKIDPKTQKIIPAWYYRWEVSTLWIEGESLNSVYQQSNPGDWNLELAYKDRSQLEIALKNWDILNQTFMHFKSYPKPEEKVYYLATIFRWHPFKIEIIREMKKEKAIALKYFKGMAWHLFNPRLPTKEEICPCNEMDWVENIYLEFFSTYKELSGDNFQEEFREITEGVKSQLTYRILEANKEFTIEFLKFMNLNPTDTWSNEKTALREIVKTKTASCYNDFAKTVMWHLK